MANGGAPRRGAPEVAEVAHEAPLLIVMGVVVLVAGSGLAIMNNCRGC